MLGVEEEFLDTPVFQHDRTAFNETEVDSLFFANAMRNVVPYRPWFEALVECKLRFGALTTYEHSWFLYRPPEDPGYLMLLSCVGYSSTNPSITRCLVYVLNLRGIITHYHYPK